MTEFSPYQAFPGQAPVHQPGPPPVLVAVADTAPQRRVTVFFRLLMIVPHAFVLYMLLIAADVIVFLGWWAALFTGRLPQWAGDFLAGLLHWGTRVMAYGLLLTDAYPPFSLNDDTAYPVRVAVPAPQRLNRAAVFFRFILSFPVSLLVAFVTLGAGTLMGLIAWLITLFAGRLPGSFHGAFTAVLRYQVRYYAYLWLLTPAYPGNLFGDTPGTPTWADEQAAAGAPAFGEPVSEGPTALGSGTTESVYGGAPAAHPSYAAGYGYPAAYGSRPVFQPASWLLPLTAAAKRLVTVFIVLGALLYGGSIATDVAKIAAASSGSDIITASNAIGQLNSSYGTLSGNMTKWENAISACGQNLTCATRQDGKAATFFTSFGNRLLATPLPSGSTAAGARLDHDAKTTAQDFTKLSQATTGIQYQSVLNSTGLRQDFKAFDTDYNALIKSLEADT